MMRFVLPPAAVLAFLVACTSTTTNNNGENASSSGSSGNSSCVPNNTDGATACGGSEMCNGGQYCRTLSCRTGCLTTANCPKDQFCDMASPTEDPFIEKNVGICRACPTNANPPQGSSGNPPVGTGSCSDVHGAYDVTLSSSSSSQCKDFLAGECNVTQDDCEVTILCQHEDGSSSQKVELNENDKGSNTQTLTLGSMTAVIKCDWSFTSSSAVADCQITAGSAGGITCKANGAKR